MAHAIDTLEGNYLQGSDFMSGMGDRILIRSHPCLLVFMGWVIFSPQAWVGWLPCF